MTKGQEIHHKNPKTKNHAPYTRTPHHKKNIGHNKRQKHEQKLRHKPLNRHNTHTHTHTHTTYTRTDTHPFIHACVHTQTNGHTTPTTHKNKANTAKVNNTRGEGCFRPSPHKGCACWTSDHTGCPRCRSTGGTTNRRGEAVWIHRWSHLSESQGSLPSACDASNCVCCTPAAPIGTLADCSDTDRKSTFHAPCANVAAGH